MESKDEKLKTCFGGDVTYTKYYEMFENANVVNFKRNKDLVDITEHVGDLQGNHRNSEGHLSKPQGNQACHTFLL